jgi:hypothetical protein
LQLGLTEKHLISGTLNANDSPLDLLFADTSGSNTESTDFFSEDSNDQARRSVMDGANSRLVSSTNEARRIVIDGANSRLASSNEEARRNAMDSANMKLPDSMDEQRLNVVDDANVKRSSAENEVCFEVYPEHSLTWMLFFPCFAKICLVCTDLLL